MAKRAATAAVAHLYERKHGARGQKAIDFLLRDVSSNPSSVLSAIAAARQNARLVRTAITREVWEAVNDTYMILKQALQRPCQRPATCPRCWPDPAAIRAGARRDARHDAAQ
jgi:uncharacterized alpha-E superfamily protein